MARATLPAAALLFAVSGCTTTAPQPIGTGPSQTPREGWVQTVSGWYATTEDCLRYQKAATRGIDIAYGEMCLEPGI